MSERRLLWLVLKEGGKVPVKESAALKREARAAALASMPEEEREVIEVISDSIAARFPKVGKGLAAEFVMALGALFDEEGVG